jgi:hypothetical protein
MKNRRASRENSARKRRREQQKREREIRRRNGMSRDEPICGEGRCCQFPTSSGKQCTREATYHLNLRKAKLFGYDLPKYNCCTYCSQHLGVMIGIYGAQAMITAIENGMSWDEYFLTHPDYVEDLKTEKGLFSFLTSMVSSRVIEYIRG